MQPVRRRELPVVVGPVLPGAPFHLRSCAQPSVSEHKALGCGHLNLCGWIKGPELVEVPLEVV